MVTSGPWSLLHLFNNLSIVVSTVYRDFDRVDATVEISNSVELDTCR